MRSSKRAPKAWIWSTARSSRDGGSGITMSQRASANQRRIVRADGTLAKPAL
jgi:hypothetical protein